MPELEKIRLTKAVGVVSGATLLSRILGFVRDIVIARCFGAGLYSDAFFVAFRIPNIFRRLFAEGSLSISFIPVFSEYLVKKGKDEAFSLAGSAVRLLSIILVAVTITGIIISPIIVRLIAPGFMDDPGKYSLTVSLTRIMFPYVFFICLTALFMGILNVLGNFAAPAFAPVLLNISMIMALSFVSPHTGESARILAFGVLAGGFLQLMLQVPFIIKKGIYFWKNAGIYHPGLKKVGVLMFPAIFGAGVYQINMFIGTILASVLPEGSVSYLYYADRLVQFPLGIFAIAAATAIFPSLSRQASENNMIAVRDTFSYSMRMVFFITLPCMVGLIVLREPIIMLLFKRGEFNIQTVRLTAQALLYYSIGLWAFSSVRIIISVFYALNDTKTPVRIAVISLLTNIVLSLLLMIPLKHGGLALANSLSSMLNVILLLQALGIKLGPLDDNKLKKSLIIIAACSVIMGGIVWTVASVVIPAENISSSSLFLSVSCCILTGIVSYGFFSYLLNSNEIRTLYARARRNVIKGD
ncbi:MAG: murein biosynthesis integral membrane protein MurJ [Proteobacteria bacterium]|nr:murein biosynthesis integral membrane protein MurJ [Pseudomonadota bacterium]